MHKKALLHKVQHPIFAGHSFLAFKVLNGKHKAIHFFYNFSLICFTLAELPTIII